MEFTGIKKLNMDALTIMLSKFWKNDWTPRKFQIKTDSLDKRIAPLLKLQFDMFFINFKSLQHINPFAALVES